MFPRSPGLSLLFGCALCFSASAALAEVPDLGTFIDLDAGPQADAGAIDTPGPLAVDAGVPEAPPPAPDGGPAAPKRKLKLAFTGIKNGSGVTPEVAVSLSEYVQSTLISFRAYEVVGTSEISTMLGIERQRELPGCSDQATSCMAEIAGALDADRGLTGEVARIESSVILNLSLIDLKTSRPIARAVRRVRAATIEPLLDDVPEMIEELVTQDQAKPTFVRGAAPTLRIAEPVVVAPPLVAPVSPAPVTQAAPLAPVQPDAPPSPFAGFSAGLRADVDVRGPAGSPGLVVGYSGRYLGIYAAGLVAKTAGARLEGRFFPLEIAQRFRPYALAGGTTFGLSPAARMGAGAEVIVYRGVRATADVAYEKFFELGTPPARPEFRDYAVVVGGGVAWLF